MAGDYRLGAVGKKDGVVMPVGQGAVSWHQARATRQCSVATAHDRTLPIASDLRGRDRMERVKVAGGFDPDIGKEEHSSGACFREWLAKAAGRCGPG